MHPSAQIHIICFNCNVTFCIRHLNRCQMHMQKKLAHIDIYEENRFMHVPNIIHISKWRNFPILGNDITMVSFYFLHKGFPMTISWSKKICSSNVSFQWPIICYICTDTKPINDQCNLSLCLALIGEDIICRWSTHLCLSVYMNLEWMEGHYAYEKGFSPSFLILFFFNVRLAIHIIINFPFLLTCQPNIYSNK